jgi:hypothetical protein
VVNFVDGGWLREKYDAVQKERYAKQISRRNGVVELKDEIKNLYDKVSTISRIDFP